MHKVDKRVGNTRIALRNIMAATDFSAHSVSVLTHGAAIARRYRSKFYVAHVIPTDVYKSVPTEAMEEALKQTRAYVQDAMANQLRLEFLQAVQNEPVIKEGQVAPRENTVASERGVDGSQDRLDRCGAIFALFPAFEADAMAAMMEREPLGEDNVPDLILMNYKGADFVGHKYGPDSDELRVTLGEMDRQLKRMLSVLEAKVGNDYLLAVTADHGMPSEPSSPDRRHLAPSIVDLLHEKFDPEAKQLITSFEPENGQIFVDEGRLSHLGLTLRDLAHFLESQPFLLAVFTNDDVRSAANALKPATPARMHSKYK